MNNENIFDGITGIREDIVQKAENYQFEMKADKKVRKRAWMKWGTMAACACVCVATGIMVPIIYNNNMHHKSDSSVNEEVGEGAIAAKHVELRIHIENLNSDGFSGSVVNGTEMFKEGEQVKVVFLSHAYVVNFDGQVFEYDEESSNIGELELAVGNDVDVWFHAELYERSGEGSLLVYAYRIDNEMNYVETVPDSTVGIVVNILKEPMNMMLPNLREDIRTPMTNEELYRYYNTDFADELNEVATFEERESTIPKGIYTYADGSVFDMNQFVFYHTQMDCELYVSIGKNTRCSQLISNMDADAQNSEMNGIEVTIFKTESGDETVYYATFKLGECDYIVSGINIEEDVFMKILGTITK